MTMKEKDTPKLSKKASSNQLLRSVSRMVLVDAKIKTKVHQKANAARSAIAKRKATGKSESADGKKGVTFAAETKPPDDSQEPDDDFLPTLDEDDADGEGEDGGGEEKKEGDDKTNDDGAEDGQGGENPEAEVKDGDEEDTKTAAEDEDKDDKKGGKKGKKKSKSKKDKREEARKRAAAKKEAEQPVGEVTVGKEQFRSFIFEKVQDALTIVCTDGVTEVNVDNVQPLLKSLDIDPSQETVMDLIKDSLIDNFGEMNPLDLDRVVQQAQEANELTEMDDCLEVAFKVIDFDEDGFITQADIYQLMLRLGEMLADYALDDMVEAVDMDKDGKISLRDFRYFLLGRDVPSRKEVFAMAAEAKKKREEAEIKAEEEAERQKFEMLKSGQCAPQPEGGEDGEPDTSQSDPSTEPHPPAGQPADGEGEAGERRAPREPDTAGQALAHSAGGSPGGDSRPAQMSPVAASPESNAVGSQSVTVTPRAGSPKRLADESEEIREKRETLFANDAAASSQLPSGEDQPATPAISGSGNPAEEAAVLELDSLSLPAGSEGDSRHQQRRLSVASSTGWSEDEFDLRRRSPIPLLRMASNEAGPLHLDVPPPDLSAVEGHAPSPLPTPLQTPVTTPRRRPTIVGIGGLAVGEGEENELDQSYVDAIEVLRQQMLNARDGNAVPDRPHRRSNSRYSIADISDQDGVSTVEDVEDYNNRLVFKLPPRRRSSTIPFRPPSPLAHGNYSSSRRGSRDDRDTFHPKHSAASGEAEGADSDEGIGLAEEELIVKSVYVASGSQAPPPNASSRLRISLPSGDGAESWVEHVPKPGALPPPTVTVDRLDIAQDDEEAIDLNSQPQQQQSDLLGVAAQDEAETPRSTATKSEMSAFNTSLTSPRTDDGSSEDDVDTEMLVSSRSGRRSFRRPVSGRTLVSARSVQSEYECDADSVVFSINDDTVSTSSHQRHVTYALDEDAEATEDEKTRAYSPSIRSGRSTPVKLSPNTKNAPLKTSIPCNTIELKELDLKSPVTADQFSNRKRFGMIPRDVSKFLVLGKTPAYADSVVGANTPRSEQHVISRGAMTSRRLSPTLRVSSREGVDVGIRRQRPQTAMTSREKDILQNRRISLMEDEILPLYDRHRDFDSPSSLETGGGSNAIEITTSNSARSPGNDTLAQVKLMERRILKRSNTSFDLYPVKEGSVTPGVDTPRSERALTKRSASASLLRRQQTTPRLLTSVSSSRPDSPLTAREGAGPQSRGKSAFASSERKASFARSVVPITRVVMAYQTARKRRQSREFYSISRDLERGGKLLQGAAKSKNANSPYALDLSGIKTSNAGKRKQNQQTQKRQGSGKRSARYSISSASGRRRPGAEEDLADFSAAAAGDDVPTLVGDLNDPDVIPDDVIFEKYRPYPHRNRNGQRSTHSSILTLELPEDARHTPKVKSVSLLSKLQIK